MALRYRLKSICLHTLSAALVTGGMLLPYSWQQTAQAQEVLNTPICVTIRNTAPWTATGTLASNSFPLPDGTTAHHRINFRLKTGEKTEICSKGPFYPGRKHELTLRTLVPIFSCMTKIDAGEIVIKGAHKPEGGTKTWAECFE